MTKRTIILAALSLLLIAAAIYSAIIDGKESATKEPEPLKEPAIKEPVAKEPVVKEPVVKEPVVKSGKL